MTGGNSVGPVSRPALGSSCRSDSAQLPATKPHRPLPSSSVNRPEEVGDGLCQSPNTRQSLTPRQAEILPLVAAGLANKQIADQLGVGVASIKQHISNLLRVLAVSNRAALAEAA